MECPVCFCWAPGDRSTGYDVDEVCPDCANDGWTRTASGEVVNLSEVAEVRPRMARASLGPIARRVVGR